MRIQKWSSDVCSSGLSQRIGPGAGDIADRRRWRRAGAQPVGNRAWRLWHLRSQQPDHHADRLRLAQPRRHAGSWTTARSEEHTSELQSLMRISYAVFCLKKKKNK